MHDERTWPGERQPRRRQPVASRVFAQRRQQTRRHSLPLDSQRHHHVGVPKRLVDGRRDVEPAATCRATRSPCLKPAQERRGAAQPEVGPRRRQRPDVGARDPRVENVAQDDHLPPGHGSAGQVRAHRVEIEQGLGRVGVPAVAAVQDGPGERFRGKIRRPGHRVADYQHFRAERLDRPDCVDERLPLRHRRRGCGDVHDVGRQVLGRDLERHPGPSRRLVEKDRHVPPAQRRDLGDRPLEDLAHRVRRAHDELDLGPRHDVQIEQVAMAPGDRLGFGRRVHRRDDDRRLVGRWRGLGGGRRAHATGSASGAPTSTRSMRTASSSSISSRWTLTISSREVGTFLPT